jgi:hypothetical protein
MITEKLFDAIDDSQDGKPLRKFCRGMMEDDVLRTDEAVSMLIVSAILASRGADDFIECLDYAAREIQNARNVAFKSIGKESDDPNPIPIVWESMQKKK